MMNMEALSKELDTPDGRKFRRECLNLIDISDEDTKDAVLCMAWIGNHKYEDLPEMEEVNKWIETVNKFGSCETKLNLLCYLMTTKIKILSKQLGAYGYNDEEEIISDI